MMVVNWIFNHEFIAKICSKFVQNEDQASVERTVLNLMVSHSKGKQAEILSRLVKTHDPLFFQDFINFIILKILYLLEQ